MTSGMPSEQARTSCSRIEPVFDHGLATLLAELHERGLADDVSIVCWGEFGRTPSGRPQYLLDEGEPLRELV